MVFIHQIAGRARDVLLERNGRKFVFLCIFSLFLRPWVKFEDLQVCRKRAAEDYFPGSPGSDTGLWSPNMPELQGTSGRETCRPECNLNGCCCSAESGLCPRSVGESLSSSPVGFSSGSVSVWCRTAHVSLDWFGAFSGLWRRQWSHVADAQQTCSLVKTTRGTDLVNWKNGIWFKQQH